MLGFGRLSETPVEVALAALRPRCGLGGAGHETGGSGSQRCADAAG